jgi:methionine-rich copper-binding protein CopC
MIMNVRRRMAVAGLGAALALAAVTTVAAHTRLQKSVPASGATVAAPPVSISLVFNEKVDVAASKVVLTGPSGAVALAAPHAMGDTQVMAPITGTLADGSYTVAWQTAGKDGHVVKGQFAFVVKRSRAE